MADLADASTPALIQAFSWGFISPGGNQIHFKIAGRDHAICLADEGSKSCGHSAAPQSGKISSLIYHW